MGLVTEEPQMSLRDMPEAWRGETMGSAGRVRYKPCPPDAYHLIPGPSAVVRPLVFCSKAPRGTCSAAAGSPAAQSPIQGLTKQRPLEALTPCCSAQLLPLQDCVTWGKAWTMPLSQGLATCRCAFILLLKHDRWREYCHQPHKRPPW